MTSQSAGAIIRSLIALEDAAGESFFGEPELDIKDWVRVNNNGKGNTISQIDREVSRNLIRGIFGNLKRW